MSMLPRSSCLRLVRYVPEGVPGVDCFAPDTEPIRAPIDGELLIDVHWLSMDPFPRMRIRGDARLAPPLPLGSVMIGRGVGRVRESRHPQFAAGDWIAGELGWRDVALHDGNGLRKLDPQLGPVQASLGLLGPSGLTGWFTSHKIGRVQGSDRVVVSAAAGSVGSVAAQLCRRAGAQVVGIGGGPAQLDYLERDLRLDAVLDHTRGPEALSRQLAAACPDGVDLFLDGVGGALHDAVFAHLAPHARVVVYGCIAGYGEDAATLDLGPRHLYALITKRIRVQGFLIADHAAEFPQALADLARLLASGELQAAETVSEGLASAPAAFRALFDAGKVGKQLVRVRPD